MLGAPKNKTAFSRRFFFVIRMGPRLRADDVGADDAYVLSNTAIDSTCDVCGNMFTTPAFFSTYPA